MSRIGQDAIVEAEKGIKIIVDGTPRIVSSDDLSPGDELSYEQVVAFYTKPIPSGPYIDVEVDYVNSLENPPDGSLGKRRERQDSRGNCCKFYVHVTDRS